VGGLIRRGLGLEADFVGFPISAWAWAWVGLPDPCRSGGHPRPSLPPGVAVPDLCRLVTGMSFAEIWVAEIFGLLKFFWVWLLCLVAVMRN
jgi:hypothetical protein